MNFDEIKNNKLYDLVVKSIHSASAMPGMMSYAITDFLLKNDVIALPYPIGTKIYTNAGFPSIVKELKEGYITSYNVNENGASTFWASFGEFPYSAEYLVNDIGKIIFLNPEGDIKNK